LIVTASLEISGPETNSRADIQTGLWTTRDSQPFGNTAVMRARTPPATAEAVSSITALRCSSVWRSRAILRPRNRLPFAIHVRTVTCAVHLILISFAWTCCRCRRARLRLGLRNYRSREKKRGQNRNASNLARKASRLHSLLPGSE